MCNTSTSCFEAVDSEPSDSVFVSYSAEGSRVAEGSVSGYQDAGVEIVDSEFSGSGSCFAEGSSVAEGSVSGCQTVCLEIVNSAPVGSFSDSGASKVA